DAPKIQPFSFPHRLKVQSKTSVMCIATDGTPPFAFSWLKDGVEVTTLKNIRREKKENDYSVLIIEPVEATNAGNYTCIVKNKAGFDSHTTYLEVEGIYLKTLRFVFVPIIQLPQPSKFIGLFVFFFPAPPEWKKEPSDKTGVLGSSVDMDCSATGSPAPKIIWQRVKANSERQLSEKIVRHQSASHPNGTLVLSNLDINDMGEYMCEADNGVEPFLKKTITVRVNG
ncbi:unnamed protein product, partial [Ixodes persulcatus]